MVKSIRHPQLALAVIAAWLAATAFVPDVRLGIAVVAIGGAIGLVSIEPGFFRRMLTPSIPLIFSGLAASVVMIVATYGLYPILAHAMPYVERSVRALYVDKLRIPSPTLLLLIVTGLIVVGEEILWRGVVQEAIERRIRGLWGVVVSAVVYGVSHAFIGSTLLVIVAVICGLYSSFIRNRTRSLVPALIAHLIWDLTILTHPLIAR